MPWKYSVFGAFLILFNKLRSTLYFSLLASFGILNFLVRSFNLDFDEVTKSSEFYYFSSLPLACS